MTVKVRVKKLSNGKKSIYLDYYNKGERSTKTIFSNIEKKFFRNYFIEAENLAEREMLKFNYLSSSKLLEDYDFKTLIDIYQNNYSGKDVRKLNALIKKLYKFLPKDFLISKLNKNFVFSFSDYLKENLNGESPKTYFQIFKRMLKEFENKGLLNKSNLNLNEIKFNIKKGKVYKSTLSLDEIKRINGVETDYIDIKKAFVFSCFSGLGYAECKLLDWSMISSNNKLYIKRCKNDEYIDIELNKSILDMLGARKKKGKVFNFESKRSKDGYLSSNTVNKVISKIVKIAKIDKHVTYYCARHSFAVNFTDECDESGINSKIILVSKALGHTNLNSTNYYLKNMFSNVHNVTKRMSI